MGTSSVSQSGHSESRRRRMGSKRKLPKCAKALLPPIATFSHNPSEGFIVNEGLQSSLSVRRTKRDIVKRKKFQCQWPNCNRASLKVPFKTASALKRHVLQHEAINLLSCSKCPMQFKTQENLKRHCLIHENIKPYTCKVCNRVYRRTSLRSRCEKHHKLVALCCNGTGYTSAGVRLDPAASGLPLSALEQEMAIERARPRPYVCAICGNNRAYTDSGSLRKHMRRYHRNSIKSRLSPVHANEKSFAPCSESIEPNESDSLTSPVRLVTTSDPVETHITITPSKKPDTANFKSPLKQPTVAFSHNADMSSDSTCALGVYHTNDTDESDQLFSFPVKASKSFAPLCVPNGVADAVAPSFNAHASHPLTNSPMDLCSSVFNLQNVSSGPPDISSATASPIKAQFPPNYAYNPADATSDTSGLLRLPNDIVGHNEDSALDLTESHFFSVTSSDEVAIDLSGDSAMCLASLSNPIDLSAPNHSFHPQITYDGDSHMLGSTEYRLTTSLTRPQQIMVNWDPEPGFSFTDLLINTEIDETDSVFRVPNSFQDCSLSLSPSKMFCELPPPLDLRLIHPSYF
ncbi:Zinc finger protein 99 [Paragonimus kellicotti]|nr:Zinc finger protein 99 [Paragonimus kellicotti]